jgi:hypothetical protein
MVVPAALAKSPLIKEWAMNGITAIIKIKIKVIMACAKLFAPFTVIVLWYVLILVESVPMTV